MPIRYDSYMAKRIRILLAVFLVLPIAPAGARVWTVAPDGTGDFTSIRAAVSAAAGLGDEIDVRAGTYHEAVSTVGKGLTLVGIGGAALVIVDADSAGSALKVPYTPADVAIRGITFTGGNGTILTASATGGRGHGSAPARAGRDLRDGRCGGGIFIETAAPVIEDCRIIDNTANSGGGIFVIGGSPRFLRCEISRNSAGNGGGIAIDNDGGVRLESCEIADNFGVFGGGVDAFNSRGLITDCRIHGNESIEGGAVRLLETSPDPLPFVISSSVLTGNSSDQGGAILARRARARCDQLTISDNRTMGADIEIEAGDFALSNTIVAYGGSPLLCEGGSVSVSCCVFWNPGTHGSDCAAAAEAWRGDPLFCDRTAGDYSLRADSPCLPGQGPQGCGRIGAFDIGCNAPVPVHSVRWGTLKRLFR